MSREGEPVGAYRSPAAGGRVRGDGHCLERPVLVVDEPVMEGADKGQVVDVGGPVVAVPELKMVRLAVARWPRAPREDAAAVADDEGAPLGDVGVTAGAGQVEGLAAEVHDRQREVCVASHAGERLDGELDVRTYQLAERRSLAEDRRETAAGQPCPWSAAQRSPMLGRSRGRDGALRLSINRDGNNRLGLGADGLGADGFGVAGGFVAVRLIERANIPLDPVDLCLDVVVLQQVEGRFGGVDDECDAGAVSAAVGRSPERSAMSTSSSRASARRWAGVRSSSAPRFAVNGSRAAARLAPASGVSVPSSAHTPCIICESDSRRLSCAWLTLSAAAAASQVSVIRSPARCRSAGVTCGAASRSVLSC